MLLLLILLLLSITCTRRRGDAGSTVRSGTVWSIAVPIATGDRRTSLTFLFFVFHHLSSFVLTLEDDSCAGEAKKIPIQAKRRNISKAYRFARNYVVTFLIFLTTVFPIKYVDVAVFVGSMRS